MPVLELFPGYNAIKSRNMVNERKNIYIRQYPQVGSLHE